MSSSGNLFTFLRGALFTLVVASLATNLAESVLYFFVLEGLWTFSKILSDVYTYR